MQADPRESFTSRILCWRVNFELKMDYLGIALFRRLFLCVTNGEDVITRRGSLLSYSLENIGIIGMGLGIGILGKAVNDEALMILGLSGALLHNLNHALFFLCNSMMLSSSARCFLFLLISTALLKSSRVGRWPLG